MHRGGGVVGGLAGSLREILGGRILRGLPSPPVRAISPYPASCPPGIPPAARRGSRQLPAGYPSGPRVASSTVDFDLSPELADLLGLCLPAELGGSGAGILGLTIAIEEVAKYSNSAALMLLLTRLPSGPILIAGN